MIIKGKDGSLCLNLNSLDENEIITLKNLKELKEDIIVNKFVQIDMKEIIQAFNIMNNKEIRIRSTVLFSDEDEEIIKPDMIINILQILMYFGYNQILYIIKDILDHYSYRMNSILDQENIAVMKDEDFDIYRSILILLLKFCFL